MEELTVDLVYGTALFEAAQDTGKLDVIKEEARAVADIFENEHELWLLINSPGIPAAEKKEVLANIFEGRISEELMNFMCILVDKGRSTHFTGMVRVYEKLVDKEEGRSYGTVYSVARLTDEHIAELEEETSKLLNVKVKLKNEIDPGLIGGFKILAEGKIIDASIRRKFDDLISQIS